MRLIVALLLLGLWHQKAAAQELFSIRSGEHGAFTRLTMPVSIGMDWRVDADQAGLRLSFSEPIESVDISTVFERIGRTRVSDLRFPPHGRGMHILLACDCGFRAYREAGGLLVIDVGESLPQTKFAGSQAFESPDETTDQVAKRSIALPLLPERAPHSLGHYLPPIGHSENQVGLEEDIGGTFAPADLQQRHEALLGAIAEAQRQGLLQGAEQNAPIQNASGSAGLSNVRTRLPFGGSARREEIKSEPEGNECVPNALLGISGWAHPSGFAAGVGQIGSRVMQEFDLVDDQALLGLARHYLHYGFGAETLKAIALFPDPPPHSDVLVAMARVIDNGHDPEAGALSTGFECEGPGTLWAILANEELPPGIQIDFAALRMAFAELPRHLQLHLGPILAARLSAAGHGTVADAVLASLVQQPLGPSADLDFAHAKLSLDRGEIDEAADLLENAIQANTVISPEALIVLIETAVAQGQEIDTAKVDLVASYVFEHRETPIEEALNRALILALAHSGRFEEAFARLDESQDMMSGETNQRTLSQVVERLVAEAPDIEFLLRTLSTQGSSLSSDVENSLARRLLSLGFAEQALEFLASPADTAGHRQRRLLRAEGALELGQPLDAEAELLGITGEDADRLMAAAREMSGDYTGALRGPVPTDAQDRHRNLAWLAGDWQTLAAGDEGILKTAAELAIARESDDPQSEFDIDSDEVLRQTAELLNQSQETRTVLNGILSEFPAPSNE